MNTKAQVSNTGCVGANFGIDAGLYSGIIEYGSGTPAAGTMDWFYGPSGHGLIDTSGTQALKLQLQSGLNPTYFKHMQYPHNKAVNGQIIIDGLLYSDNFGGTGWIDSTSFNTASKNGEDPAIWDPGPQNVLGKNDLIDVAGAMFRNGLTLNDDLWFVGMINRAEPGGDAYMDFEFFVEDVNYSPTTGFTTGGPQLGHTAFQFDASGNITKVGDFIFNVSLTGGGSTPSIEVRLWVSYADYAANLHPAGFTWGPNYDGAFMGSPYGYASIIPATPEICGIVNTDGQHPLAPPWGTQGTKANTWATNYMDFSVVEVGLNMTEFGIDHTSLSGLDTCSYPIHTFMVKTRASNSFTAQLKDFAGPFDWGQPYVNALILGLNGGNISCSNPIVTLIADPIRDDVTHAWTTIDGNIITDPTNDTIQVDQPGTYTLTMTFANGCQAGTSSRTVIIDPTRPLFNTPTTAATVACNGNGGTINLTVSGGSAPFLYSWSNGATTQDLTGLSANNYSVTITDKWGCVISATAVVPPHTPMIIVPSATPAQCDGSADGSVTLAVTGKSPFTFAWSNGNLTQNIANLPAGNYIVTVTDADGCTKSETVTVTEPAPISILAVGTDETDPTLNNGSATLTVGGGTPVYTFLWSNGSTLQNQTGVLSRGTYTVTVTDAHGCEATASVVIWEPEVCNDGIDNDGDGLTDCQDAQCTPATPGTITPGNTTPCVGDIVTYSVVNNPSLTGYFWTVPSGATLQSGQGTNSITVQWNTQTGGQICVRADSLGCLSTPVCITVIPDTTPPTPDDIIVH